MPVRGWQLADVLGPEAHHPGEVAGVVQAAHDETVQVHGFDEVAEEGALQPQHVPPGAREEGQRDGSPGGRAERAAPVPPRGLRLGWCWGFSLHPGSRVSLSPSSRQTGRASVGAPDPVGPSWPWPCGC